MTGYSDFRKVVIHRRIQATPVELFDAWSDPEGMRAWMCPGNILSVEVRMDFRVGGALVVTMRDSAGTYEHHGEFTIIERPSRLAFTWIAAATDGLPTLVTVEFSAVSPTESELVLTHEHFPRQGPADQYRAGWDEIVGKLEQYWKSMRPA